MTKSTVKIRIEIYGGGMLREKDAMKGEMDRWTICGREGFTEKGKKVYDIIKARPFRRAFSIMVPRVRLRRTT